MYNATPIHKTTHPTITLTYTYVHARTVRITSPASSSFSEYGTNYAPKDPVPRWSLPDRLRFSDTVSSSPTYISTSVSPAALFAVEVAHLLWPDVRTAPYFVVRRLFGLNSA